MFVKFIGQGELSFEYNGKRFFFNRNTPPVEIAPHIYDYVKSSRTVESAWLQPCDAPASEDLLGLQAEIADLKKENKTLKDKVKHLEDQTNSKPSTKKK